MEQKYTALLAKAVGANKLEAKESFDENAKSADIVYAMQAYATIPDSTIQVSNSDVKLCMINVKTSSNKKRLKC